MGYGYHGQCLTNGGARRLTGSSICFVNALCLPKSHQPTVSSKTAIRLVDSAGAAIKIIVTPRSNDCLPVNPPATDPYQNRIQFLLLDFGITAEVLGQRALALHREPETLVEVPRSKNAQDLATPYRLTTPACSAWLAMQEAAQADAIPLALVSAFRSVERQREIITAKLAQGQAITEILASVAPPGYSEHHTGRAIDVGTREDAALEEVFETTASYAWLQAHAQAYGFVMSYPRNNPQGFVFEPWHWCYQGPLGTGVVSTSSIAAVSASISPAYLPGRYFI